MSLECGERYQAELAVFNWKARPCEALASATPGLKENHTNMMLKRDMEGRELLMVDSGRGRHISHAANNERSSLCHT